MDTHRLEAKPCDMCDGSGKALIYVHPNGVRAYCTTDSPMSQSEFDKLETRPFPCETCEGTGILPHYLMPEYWEQKTKFNPFSMLESLGNFVKEFFAI